MVGNVRGAGGVILRSKNCSFCGKYFAQPGKLAVHLPLCELEHCKCNICGKLFTGQIKQRDDHQVLCEQKREEQRLEWAIAAALPPSPVGEAPQNVPLPQNAPLNAAGHNHRPRNAPLNAGHNGRRNGQNAPLNAGHNGRRNGQNAPLNARHNGHRNGVAPR